MVEGQQATAREQLEPIEPDHVPPSHYVYNRALSAAEIAYIATDETGIFTVQSVANLYNDEALGDRAVNLRDFAKLSENWLEKKLWPE